MMVMLRKLWRDDCGAVVSIEIVVIATVLVIALLAAWAAVRNAVFTQINEQAEWIAGTNQQAQPITTVQSLEELEATDGILTAAEVFGNDAGQD
jgi:Flp pilus assembly pilin Flp